MQWSEIVVTPTIRTLRQFAGLGLLFFGGFAVFQGLVRGQVMLALALGCVALAAGVLGLWRPSWLRVIYMSCTIIAFPIGWTTSHLLLAGIFYGLFTPLAALFRLLGRDALNLRRRPDSTTYWRPKPAPVNVRSYFRQF